MCFTLYIVFDPKMIKEFVTLLSSCHLIFTFGLFCNYDYFGIYGNRGISGSSFKIFLLTPQIAENSTLSYQRLILYADKDGIILTVWGSRL
ncbi:hypothetical protein CEXT_34001 [Caerostris extrusa]|uniref:Uncharacterized protein n=1 Tax=Caerostris extrusa TaxID=172846 RepID=A0AAV4Q7V0_CAEEX|nr:hypothetical protein CEXT_34001 [Caerostris extrusa]